MAGTTTLEQRSIDYVPAAERHGRPRSLMFLWFAANTSITAVVTGALFVVVGNTALWSIPAIIIGNLFGAFFTSLHSVQGPKLGVPQMIQSRAQFGYLGAILPLVLALLIYIGFYATGLVLGGQAIARLFHIPQQLGAALFALCSTALAIFGYRHIHRYSHLAAVLSGVVFLGLFIRILTDPASGSMLSDHTFAGAPFILGISLSASWQLTFGPYVADYSRYLPENTSPRATFGWTFAGSVLGGSLAMTLGALAAGLGGKAFMSNEVGYLADLGGIFSVVVLLAVICGKLTGNTLSSYGGYMSAATIVTSLTRGAEVRPRHRVIYIGLISLVSLLIALSATDSFLTSFTNFLLFLLYFIVPWSAINLVDFYWVRHEQYDIDDLFRPDGAYGRWNVRALTAYVIGVLVQIPFMNSSVYVGPIADLMGGAELSWVLGLVVSGGLYYLMTTTTRTVKA